MREKRRSGTSGRAQLSGLRDASSHVYRCAGPGREIDRFVERVEEVASFAGHEVVAQIGDVRGYRGAPWRLSAAVADIPDDVRGRMLAQLALHDVQFATGSSRVLGAELARVQVLHDGWKATGAAVWLQLHHDGREEGPKEARGSDGPHDLTNSEPDGHGDTLRAADPARRSPITPVPSLPLLVLSGHLVGAGEEDRGRPQRKRRSAAGDWACFVCAGTQNSRRVNIS